MKSRGAPLGTGKFGISAGLCGSMNLLLLANIQTDIGHDMFVVVSVAYCVGTCLLTKQCYLLNR